MSDAEWIAATNQERGLIRERDKALKERDKLQAKIDEVLVIHRPTRTRPPQCKDGCNGTYPCDTRRAAGAER